jgi:hypothetical protein
MSTSTISTISTAIMKGYYFQQSFELGVPKHIKIINRRANIVVDIAASSKVSASFFVVTYSVTFIVIIDHELSHAISLCLLLHTYRLKMQRLLHQPILLSPTKTARPF